MRISRQWYFSFRVMGLTNPRIPVVMGPPLMEAHKTPMILEQQIMPRNMELTNLCIRTWNVWSVYRTGTTIISYLKRYRLDITAVQDVSKMGQIWYYKVTQTTVVYSGGEKYERGIGFIIIDKFLPNIVKLNTKKW